MVFLLCVVLLYGLWGVSSIITAARFLSRRERASGSRAGAFRFFKAARLPDLPTRQVSAGLRMTAPGILKTAKAADWPPFELSMDVHGILTSGAIISVKNHPE
jgi:hypothetical protein